MGIEYALVHIKYTIPPAILLTLFQRPLLTRIDAYKIGFLISVAVISTIPWDSYLIRNRIWTYPSHVIVGPKLFDIPAEEVFFFVIQTYTTSLLYLILSKPTFQPSYLRAERHLHHPRGPTNAPWRFYKLIGQLAFAFVIKTGIGMIKEGGEGTYMGLILVWAAPFLLFLWSLAYQFIIGLPLTNTLIPIALPTLYLWIVDTFALKRGTWVIEKGTKLGIHVFDGLEIEEAAFFLLTNTLIVFGQLAFDNALCIVHAFPNLFPNSPAVPSPLLLMRALMTSASEYDEERIYGFQEAVNRLKRKSRSFYLASSTFQGQIRMDLILLYSFCRAADDLVDNASSQTEAQQWIAKLRKFLELSYKETKDDLSPQQYARAMFPPKAQSALLQLPTYLLSQKPLDDLLKGFEMDLGFAQKKGWRPPIETETDLELYARRVAGTVAQMCIELIFHDCPCKTLDTTKARLIEAGNRMGIALQYVNIARDIKVDAKMDRVYLPSSWLKESDLTYSAVIENPQGTSIERLRSRLLDKAFTFYAEARGAIEELPREACGPLRVAVESYMEIGRVLRQKGYQVKAGKATVPIARRLRVAWRALNGA